MAALAVLRAARPRAIAQAVDLGGHCVEHRIETRAQIEIIIEQATVPVVVDAGLGAPSQAAEAMEMGADAVLINTAIAVASGWRTLSAKPWKPAAKRERLAWPKRDRARPPPAR